MLLNSMGLGDDSISELTEGESPDKVIVEPNFNRNRVWSQRLLDLLDVENPSNILNVSGKVLVARLASALGDSADLNFVFEDRLSKVAHEAEYPLEVTGEGTDDLPLNFRIVCSDNNGDILRTVRDEDTGECSVVWGDIPNFTGIKKETSEVITNIEVTRINGEYFASILVSLKVPDTGSIVEGGPLKDNIIKKIDTGLFAQTANLAWDNDTKKITFTSNLGDSTEIDLSQFVSDIHVDNADFNVETSVLTLYRADPGGSDPQEITIDLGELSKSKTVNTNSIELTGNGTRVTPLRATLKISQAPGNALVINEDGVYAPPGGGGGELPSNLGTAAYANVVTSQTDATPGRVPVVGWMGLGSFGVEYGVNSDHAKRNEFWRQGNGNQTTWPSTCGGVTFSVDSYGGQIALALASDRVYARRWTPSGWANPFEFLTNKNILQTTGNTTTLPMSQIAVTNELNRKVTKANTTTTNAVRYIRLGRVYTDSFLSVLVGGGTNYGSNLRCTHLVSAGSRGGEISLGALRLSALDNTTAANTISFGYVPLDLAGRFDVYAKLPAYGPVQVSEVVVIGSDLVTVLVQEATMPEGFIQVPTTDVLTSHNLKPASSNIDVASGTYVPAGIGWQGLGGNIVTVPSASPLDPTRFGYTSGIGFYLQARFNSTTPAFRISNTPYTDSFYLEGAKDPNDGTYRQKVQVIHSGNIQKTVGSDNIYPMTQKAVTDALNLKADKTAVNLALTDKADRTEVAAKLDKTSVLQSTGTSTTSTMSQAAITSAIAAGGGGGGTGESKVFGAIASYETKVLTETAVDAEIAWAGEVPPVGSVYEVSINLMLQGEVGAVLGLEFTGLGASILRLQATYQDASGNMKASTMDNLLQPLEVSLGRIESIVRVNGVIEATYFDPTNFNLTVSMISGAWSHLIKGSTVTLTKIGQIVE